jgi:signal peptidase
VLLQVLNFVSVIASGLMIWKALGLVCNTESPIVVVLRYIRLCTYESSFLTFYVFLLSGSMEPAFYRGDILFLTNPRNTPYVVGDITVYKVPGGDIPIVHRVIETHKKLVIAPFFD